MKSFSRHIRTLFLLALTVGAQGCTAPRPSAEQTSPAPHNDRAAARRFGEDLPRRIAAEVEAQVPPHDPIQAIAEHGTSALQLPPRELLLRLYALHGDRPIFVTADRLNPLGRAADELFARVLFDGLDPSRFHADRRRALLEALRAPVTANFDRLLGAEDQQVLERWWSDDANHPDDATALRLLIDATKTPLPHVAAAYANAVAERTLRASQLREAELTLAADYLTWIDLQRAANRYYEFPIRKAVEMEVAVAPEAEAKRRADETVRLAGEGLTAADPAAYLAGLRPQSLDYTPLRAATERYFGYAVAGAWQPLTGTAVLGRKSKGPEVVALRARLAAEGYDAGAAESATFDEPLRKAVRQFQLLHQLPVSGRLDADTRAALNVSATTRLAQLGVALDRWRLSRAAPDFGKEHIFVNVAGFDASLQDKGEAVYRWKVVVGKWIDRVRDDGQRVQKGLTPLISETMQFVVFNPYWNVPEPIRRSEYQAKMDADPNWLADNGYEMFRDEDGGEWLRQLPGPDNLLGAVKFLFPNDHNVYLHDTPAKALFDQPVRAYSHGCIRVHEPMKLAALLLKRDRNWSDKRVEKFIEEQVKLATEQWVGLNRTIPVHLEYEGVGVTDEGQIAFYGDIYRLDVEALAAKEALFESAIAAARAALPRADGTGSGDGSGDGSGSGSGSGSSSGSGQAAWREGPAALR